MHTFGTCWEDPDQIEIALARSEYIIYFMLRMSVASKMVFRAEVDLINDVGHPSGRDSRDVKYSLRCIAA